MRLFAGPRAGRVEETRCRSPRRAEGVDETVRRTPRRAERVEKARCQSLGREARVEETHCRGLRRADGVDGALVGAWQRVESFSAGRGPFSRRPGRSCSADMRNETEALRLFGTRGEGNVLPKYPV